MIWRRFRLRCGRMRKGIRGCNPTYWAHEVPLCRAPRDRKRSWDLDRKSTRLNSSHDQISYAVFCLKKKYKYYFQAQDNCSGPGQNVCTGPDGIGDIPYVLQTGQKDRYPLVVHDIVVTSVETSPSVI